MRAGLIVALVVLLGGAVYAITQANKAGPSQPQASAEVPAQNYSPLPAAPAPQQTTAPAASISVPQAAEQYPAATEDNIVETASVPSQPITVQEQPPPMPIYVVPPPPAPNYAWVPGHWMWNGNGYYWIPGTWVQPPAPHVLWTPGYWAWKAGLFMWHVGYWGPHIGFYGGVHYGGGYDGIGFSGGEWRNNNYVVNRSVTNVTNITNVTNVTNIRNVTNETASFNGGPGGINAQPTPQQEAALHEHHVPPPAEQIQHMQAARANESLRASVNGGKPPIAATSEPIRAPASNREMPREERPNPSVERMAPAAKPEEQVHGNPVMPREEKSPNFASSPRPEEKVQPHPATIQENGQHPPPAVAPGEATKPKGETRPVQSAPPTAPAQQSRQEPHVQTPGNKPVPPKRVEPHPPEYNQQHAPSASNAEKGKQPEEKKPEENDHQEREHPKDE